MADIFDELESKQAGDVFDEIDAPQPAGGIMRSLGLGVRSAGPYAAAAAAGAAAGAPFAGIGAGPGALAGLGAYGLTRIVGDPAVNLYNSVRPESFPEATPPSVAVNSLLDSFLPKPETPMEKIADTTAQAVGDSVSFTGLGNVLARSASPVVSNVGQTLAAAPKMDAAMSAGSGLGLGVAQQAAPDSALAQVVGSLAAPTAMLGAGNASRAAMNWLGPDNIAAYAGGLGKGGAREAAAREYAASKISESLKGMAKSGIDDAVSSLRNADALATGGYRPTSGTLSGNAGLISAEKGVASDPRVLERYLSNQRAINAGIDDVVTPSGAKPQAAQKFMRQAVDGQQMAAARAADSAADDVARAEARVAGNQSEVTSMAPDTVRTGASAQVRESLGSNFDNYRAKSAELYEAVPETVVVPVGGAVKRAQQLVAEAEGTVGEVPAAIKRFIEISGEGAMPAAKAQRNLEELYAELQNVPKNSPASKAIADLRDALDNDISKVEAVSEPLATARTFYRDELAPRFKQGASASVLNRRGAGGTDAVEPGKTLDKYMGGEAEAGRLKKALADDAGKLPEGDAMAVRDWAISKMAASLGNNPTGSKIRAWMSKNDSVVSQFPEIKNEINRMANRIGGSARLKDKMAGELTARQAELKTATEAATDSNIAQFAKNNPVVEVGSFLYKGDADRRMAELARQAKRDPSGKAFEGLRNAVKESISLKVKAFGSNPKASNNIDAIQSGDLPATIAKMNRLLIDGTPTRRAMQRVFSKSELGTLDKLRKQLEVSNRINWKATANSDTETNLTNAREIERAVRRGAWNVGVIRASKTLGSILDVAGAAGRAVIMQNPEQFAKELLIDAMLNPKLAAELLTRPTPTRLPMLKMAVTPFVEAYIQGNAREAEKKQARKASPD